MIWVWTSYNFRHFYCAITFNLNHCFISEPMVKIKEKNSKMKKDVKRIGNALIEIIWYLKATNAKFSSSLDDSIQFVSYRHFYDMSFTVKVLLDDTEFE